MNLIIGNTSQQSYYYPDDYVRISSRNLDFNFLKQNKFNSVYVTFAEQRIYDDNIDYINPNFLYVLKIIENVLDNSNKIVLFTSCELWANKVGLISLDSDPDFNIKNQYTISKLLLFNEIKRLRKIDDRYNKIIMVHPFYFNSCKRSPYFLFGKIYNSIIKKEKINTGNLNFYRDIIHPKFVASESIKAEDHQIIGSGRMVYVNDFIRDLYTNYGLEYNDYVTETENTSKYNEYDKRKEYYLRSNNCLYSYKQLLYDTIEDIDRKIK